MTSFRDEFSKTISTRILPRAVRAYALAAIAHNDAAIACWDAKYTYWAARPNQLDASITTLFPNPGHPTYPSAHGCFSGAIARTIGRFFPDFSEAMDAKATEAAESRFWSGIYFRSDLEIGLTVGRSVGDAVIERASSDGSVREASCNLLAPCALMTAGCLIS